MNDLRTPRRRPRWSIRGIATLLTGAVVAAVAAVILPASPAAAVDPPAEVVSWNMQGSSHSTENKWNVGVRRLLASADLIALQEAGTVPASAQQIHIHFPHTGAEVYEYVWNLGTASRPDNIRIFWMQTDRRGNRVNLAIATRIVPEQVRTVPVPGQRRPTLGVRFGDQWVFTVHGNASGGAAAGNPTAISDAIDDAVQSNSRVVWRAYGDWNTSPRNVHFPYTPGFSSAGTHPSTNPTDIYDYAVASRYSLAAVVVVAWLLLSDHLAVKFTP